jgi:hypothetical protein
VKSESSETWHGKVIIELLDRIREGKPLVLFAGAGISATAGVRTGQQLSNDLRIGHPTLFRSEENLSYSDVFRRAVPNVKFRRALIEEECLGKSSQTEHLWIAQLVKEERLRAVITTNFDHLIEHALMRVGASRISIVLNDDEFRMDLNARKGTPMLVKVHGDFLFDHIANLPEELAAKLRQNMSHALLDLTTEADLLVIGYSGSDDTIVQLIGEIVRNRSASTTRVWWSEFTDEDPPPGSTFDQLLRSADRARNPITRLGPWSAQDCLTSLGVGIGLDVPKPCPFGIGSEGLTMPACFAWPLQDLPATHELRAKSLRSASRLCDWVDRGGVILVVHDPGAGGSTLLGAVAERAADRGLYFDSRFGERPIFLDLRRHLIAFASHLGTEDIPEKIFSRGAIVVIDSLELPSLTSAGDIEHSFLQLVERLADGQKKAKCGALVLSTRVDPSVLRRKVPWLPSEEGTYRLHQPVLMSTKPPKQLDRLLNVLGLTTTAIPRDCAIRAAFGGDINVDWRNAAAFVDNRGQKAILHDKEIGYRSSKLLSQSSAARDLARELLLTAETLPPLRRLGLALEAEAQYFCRTNSKREALHVFLGCAEAGMRHPFTKNYFIGTLRDYVETVVALPAEWIDLPLPDAIAFTRLVGRIGAEDPASLNTFLNTMIVGRSDLEKRLLLIAMAPEAVSIPTIMPLVCEEDESRNLAQSIFRYWLTTLVPSYRKARRRRRQPYARASAALQISAAWYELGHLANFVPYYHRGVRWSQRARRDAVRSRDASIAALAQDNEIFGLLAINSLNKAEELLRERSQVLGQDQGFSASKAVTFSNYFQLKLRQRDYLSAEAHFFEAVLQSTYLLRWHGIAGNLALLAHLARDDDNLPSPDLVEVARKNLIEQYDANPL